MRYRGRERLTEWFGDHPVVFMWGVVLPLILLAVLVLSLCGIDVGGSGHDTGGPGDF